MSDHRLPQEIIDYILDLLHEEPRTLKRCYLVSRSWAPRARTHLFHTINFYSFWCCGFDSWKMAFREPINSPGSLVHTLGVHYLRALACLSDEGGWIQSFPHVVRLEIGPPPYTVVPLSQVFKLICSLPLLEDLKIRAFGMDDNNDDGAASEPSTPPPLTGALELQLLQEIEPVARRLLDLPNGLRFKEFECVWNIPDDARWITALVERCAETLEYFHVRCRSRAGAEVASINLSKATRLREVGFRLLDPYDVWAGSTLKTLTSNHKDLRRISIHMTIREHANLQELFGIDICDSWADLDCTLIQLWESNAVTTRVTYATGGDKAEARKFVEQLLPEMTRRGIVELVDTVIHVNPSRPQHTTFGVF